MGTDIHGRVYVRWNNEAPWHDEGEIYSRRNYLMFAILANVRNGFGFAGVPTHETILPISEPRGLPDDVGYSRHEYYDGNHQIEIQNDFGEHSQTWLTLDEILAWPHWNSSLLQHGIVDRAEFERMEREGGNPKTWCGGAWGSNVIIARGNERPEGWTYMEMSWEDGPIKELVGAYWEWFQFLKAAHGEKNVRLVIGFDS